MKRFLTFITCSLCFYSLEPVISTQTCNFYNNSYKEEQEQIVNNSTSIVESKDNPYPRYKSLEVGGGWWTRGLYGIKNISEYKHHTLQGHASCENGFGQFSDGAWVDANFCSESAVLWAPWGNKAYYNYR